MPTITAYISTKDRYFTSLPLAIMSIAMQTHKPDKFVLYDDGEQKDLRGDNLYQNMFMILDDKKIKWEVIFGKRQGQVANHQHAVDNCTTEWLWRLDDDDYAEPTCLENLLHHAKNKVGAVGGLVIHPNYNCDMPSYASNKIKDVFSYPTIQWYKHKGVSEVDHLYSTFIYRKEAAKHGYCRELSRVGHREETLFTYEMTRNGWKCLVEPKAITWHLRSKFGGIRNDNYRLWEHDDEVFLNKLRSYNIEPKFVKLIVLDNGLGDHLAFKQILPEMKAKYKDLVLAVCFPEVFKDDGVELISISDAKSRDNIDKYSIYKWAWDNNWKSSLVDAYRKLYL